MPSSLSSEAREVPLSTYPLPVHTKVPQKTTTFERRAKRALKSATLQLKQSIPHTTNHYIWRQAERGLTNGCGHSSIYCISAINLKLYIPLNFIITLYLLLGVASGVLHPAQGCKILVVYIFKQAPSCVILLQSEQFSSRFSVLGSKGKIIN